MEDGSRQRMRGLPQRAPRRSGRFNAFQDKAEGVCIIDSLASMEACSTNMEMDEPMRILVVGAGATGGYFGARLALAGRDVTFLVRQRRAENLRARGLRITGHGDAEVVTPALVTADELTDPTDLVLLAVKATALSAVLDDMAQAVGPDTLIVPFLNGIAHLDKLNDRFGARNVLGGVVMVATQLNDAGDIIQLAPFASLQIGPQDGHVTARIKDAHDTLAGAGFDTAISEDILAAMWHKWVFISTVGALTCLTRGTVGDIVAAPEGEKLGPAILAEAAAVSAAAGYPVPQTELDSTTHTITEPASAFASSMFRDVSDRHHTEVEHVLADLAARARTFQVSTPLLDLATLHLRVYEDRLAKDTHP